MSPHAAITTSGTCPASLLAQSQRPMPLLQWLMAASMSRNCRWFCLSHTITLMLSVLRRHWSDDGEQAVRVRRQVDARHRRALVADDVEEARVLVRETVVILSPDGRSDQQVERRDRRAPRQLLADVEPLRVLVEHRVDHVDERFVRREETVPTREQVALEPAFQRVLRQHLHHAAVDREFAAFGVDRQHVGEPGLAAGLVHRVELVRRRLVRTEHAEVVGVQPQDVAQELAELARIAGFRGARLFHRARRYSRKSGRRSARRSWPPFACGFALMRWRPCGASALSSGTSRPAASNSSCGR